MYDQAFYLTLQHAWYYLDQMQHVQEYTFKAMSVQKVSSILADSKLVVQKKEKGRKGKTNFPFPPVVFQHSLLHVPRLENNDTVL